ncbi:hypothetical protein KCP74_23720 [Salmonella enterica subsp. enterica]|nr:hypothetical protein KCP74_23720 [Salmonella enterica subsp. enterica]
MTWLEIAKSPADGTVIDVSLCGRVRNWDNTVAVLNVGSKSRAACLRPADAGFNAALILTRPVFLVDDEKQRLLTAPAIKAAPCSH